MSIQMLFKSALAWRALVKHSVAIKNEVAFEVKYCLLSRHQLRLYFQSSCSLKRVSFSGM